MAETDAVADMPRSEVRFADGKRLTVRVARTSAHRAAGMQHLCADAVADTPILFVYESPRRPRFHMNNVHAPLDIVFIAPDGRVVSVERMTPEQSHLTRAESEIIGALELPAGQAEALSLTAGSQVTW